MLNLILVVTLAQTGIRDIPLDTQLFNSAIVSRFTNSRGSNALALWPTPQLGGQSISRQRVPNEILAEAEVWINRIVRPAWRPNDIVAMLIPFDDFRGNDILADRFRINGWTIQVIEKLAQVCITVIPPEELRITGELTRESAKQYLIQLLQITNFPETEIGSVTWSLTPIDLGSGVTYVSAIGEKATVGTSRDYWHWWQELTAWTDGTAGSFMFHKRTGSRSEVLGATEQQVANKRFRDSE